MKIRIVEDEQELRIYIPRITEGFLWGMGLLFAAAIMVDLISAIRRLTPDLSLGCWPAVIEGALGISVIYIAIFFARRFSKPLVYRFNRGDGQVYLADDTIGRLDDIAQVTIEYFYGGKGGFSHRIALLTKEGQRINLYRATGSLDTLDPVARAISRYLNVPQGPLPER